ncbi:MAG: hypothetical protein SWX82_35495 [Cyanobacteriota bacterium]|nr:hypothetical protein [Cyanobacteriota bacterium]
MELQQELEQANSRTYSDTKPNNTGTASTKKYKKTNERNSSSKVDDEIGDSIAKEQKGIKKAMELGGELVVTAAIESANSINNQVDSIAALTHLQRMRQREISMPLQLVKGYQNMDEKRSAVMEATAVKKVKEMNNTKYIEDLQIEAQNQLEVLGLGESEKPNPFLTGL